MTINIFQTYPSSKFKKQLFATGLLLTPFLAPLQHSLAAEKTSGLLYLECEEGECTSDYEIQNEEHSILELISLDQNFIHTHPTNVMSAAQIIYAMIMSQGSDTTQVPGYGSLPVYRFFSKKNDITQNRMIIGHYEGIKAVVDGIEAQARGSKTGVKVPLLVGTHGTGKSEFRSVIAAALKKLTRNDKKFFMHEIAWRMQEVKNIPAIKDFVKANLNQIWRSPLHSAPISILPEAYQKILKEQAPDIMDAKFGFRYPAVELLPDPISKTIREAILEYYLSSQDDYVTTHLSELGISKDLSGRFRPLDEVKILDRYVTIKRVILGEPGTCPLIDAQGDDVDYQGLIMSENALMRALAGPGSVWAWNYNGAVLSGSRNFTFLDEFFRNEAALRDVFLGITESRQVSRSGSPAVPIDTVIIAATNSASIEHALNDTRSQAQVNRMRQIPFEWNIHPSEIGKTLLYMTASDMKMQPLAGSREDSSEEIQSEERPYEPIDLDQLFPSPRASVPVLTPSGRFKLVWGKNETNHDSVFISPHTLEFMANFIAATRFNTSTKDAQALKGGEQIIGDPIFRDPLARIKVLMHEIAPLPSQIQELYTLSQKLREGSFGLGARVAGTWFTEALIEAKDASNDYTLTPVILRKVYLRLQDQHTLEIPDLNTQLKWRALLDSLAEGYLIPKLHSDIYMSFDNDGRAAGVYDELMLEIITLSQDPGAKTYESTNSQMMTIDKTRLKAIQAIYKTKNGKDLSIQQIANFYLNQLTRSHEASKNKELLDAISEYLAKSLDVSVSIKDLLDYAEKKSGSRDTSEKYQAVEQVLVHKLGYNKRSIIDALRIIKQYNDSQQH